MGRALPLLGVLFPVFLACPSITWADPPATAGATASTLGSVQATLRSEVPDEILVRLISGSRGADRRGMLPARPDASRRARDIQSFARRHELELIRDYGRLNLVRLRLPAGRSVRDALQRLRGDAQVEFAQPNYVYAASSCPSDPELIPQQWGVFSTFLPSLWRPGDGANGKVIAFLDTGVESGHSELDGGLWTNGDELPGNSLDDDDNGYIDDLHGWNFVADNADIADDNGHGTRMTGIACARANNGIGIAGVAHKATYLPVKILNEFGTGVSSDIAAGLEYAAASHPDIINMSFNVAATPFEPDADCIVREQIATALASGCVLVGASGNSGGSFVHLPAAFPGVISVGATHRFGGVWSHSSHGSGLDVVAPGVDIYTTWLGNTFKPDSGTSEAAAFVSGVCALLLEKFPGTRPWEMERYVRTLARDTDGKMPGVSGNLDGYGLISFGTLADFSNGALPPAWSLDDFFEFLGSDWSGESSMTDTAAVGANDDDDDMPDLDGLPNSSGHDAFDDGLFNLSAPRLPLLHAHLYGGPPPPLTVKVGVGDFTGNRWDGGAEIGVRSWIDWNDDNQLTDPAERIFSTVSAPRTWGANEATLDVAWTPSDEHFRGNPLRARTRLFGPGTTATGSVGMQEFGEVEDQAVLNFVEDFDVPIPHPSAYADFGAGWSIVPDDAASDCYFLPPGPPDNRGVYNMAFVHRTTPCPMPESSTLLLPESGAPALDLRELTRCYAQLWYAHSVAAHCSESWHDDCRVVLRRFDANMVPLPDVTLYQFPEPDCPTAGYAKGQVPTLDLSPYVGGYARLAIVHDITDVYDALAIDDVRIYGWDDQNPAGTALDAASMTRARVATVTWRHPRENAALLPSDPVIELYGARLWTGTDTWNTAYRLTPRDFAVGASSFPKAGPPGTLITDSLRVPSVFPAYQIGLRAQDEEALEGPDVPRAFSTTATFSPVVAALDTLVVAQPGDTVQVAFMLSSAGNALDAIMADAVDTRNWLLCPRRWADVFDPGGASVELLELAIPLSATVADTDTVFVTASSLSGGGPPALAFARVIIDTLETPPPDTTVASLDCDSLYVTNGLVWAMVRSGNRLYIGGSFDRVGPATGSGVAVDALTGLPLSLPRIVGSVEAVAPDGVGGWFVGGTFSRVGGLPRSNLAHILSDNSVASWDPGVAGTVYTLALQGTTLYVGGNFVSIGGEARHAVAAVDAVTGNVSAWNPNPAPTSSYVWDIAVGGTQVYVCGNFTSIGGQPRTYMAGLDAATGNATIWNPTPGHGVAFAIAVSGTIVYAAGSFYNVGGQGGRYLAALDATTGIATSWDPNPNSVVYALAVSDSTVYAGGNFASVGGQSRPYLAALSATTGNATSWNPNANGPVRELSVLGGRVYAGGDFSSIGGQPRNRLAAVEASTGNATAWNPNPNAQVLLLEAGADRIYVGGEFTSIGCQTRNNIAAIDVATGRVTEWDPNANGGVSSMAVSGTTVYVGGRFSSIGGQARNNIAAIDATTASATPWNPDANDGVNTLALDGNTVYVGGLFTNAGGQPRNRVAAIDAITGAATDWNPGANDEVWALASSGSTIYVSGLFTSIGGQLRNWIAALDAATGDATPWNPDPDGEVVSVALSGTTLYATGWFGNIGGQARNSVAAVSTTTGAALAWNPNPIGAVATLLPQEGLVFVGGDFTQIGGLPRAYFAALDAVSGDAKPLQGAFDSSITTIAADSSTVYVGGAFLHVGGFSRSYLACLTLAPATVDVAEPRPAGGVAFARLAPNPSSQATRLEFTLPRATNVRIRIFDIQGRVVARLVDERKPAGTHSLLWNDRRCGPGVYLVRFEAGGQTMTRRLVRIW